MARYTAGAFVILCLLLMADARGGIVLGPTRIKLTPLGGYEISLFDEGAVEIAAYDPGTRRAFLTFAARPRIDIVDLSDPHHPFLTATIDLTPWGGPAAHATSVAVQNGVVAAAVPQGEDDTGLGRALFFNPHGVLLAQVTVGALPDMITFTPNGQLVLTANEGQPNSAYTFDPEGSISIIDIRRGIGSLSDANVTTAGFSAFNAVPLDPSIHIFGPRATVAQDLEPEFIAVSPDSQTAWVTLQENNALALVDLGQKRVTRLVGLGFKDHSKAGLGLDGGRDDGGINIKTWPVLGMYQPDAIATFTHMGHTYLATTNEGDAREYDGLGAPKASDTNDETVEIEDIRLDRTAFPDFALFQNRANGIARLKVTSFKGDTDGDGDYDKLYTYGARSFSIWSADGALVFDSGDALEQLTAAALPATFNASHTNNTRDDRSDDKGPEPEGLIVTRIFGRPYLFLTLERIGGVVIYDVSNPMAPAFVQYVNTRNFSATPGTPAAGDLGPEGVRVVDARMSPTGKPLLLVSNEVSGSLRIFGISPLQ